MAPTIQTASLGLSYPVYACDFDPQDANRLVVGGGGGVSKTGVHNKISVIDASHSDSLQVVSELDLSANEDSVTSLAVGPKRANGKSILVFAGVNSSPADVVKGKNEHFRVFTIEPSLKAKAQPGIAEISREAIFKANDTNTYQRVLRISQPFGDLPQLGAIATGFAKEPQIAVFDVLPARPFAPRGIIEIDKEANDLDIIQTGDGEYQLVYCDDYEIYTLNIGKKTTTGPTCVFTIPHDESPRPSFRSIRYLTPTFVLAAANIPKAGGVVLQGFRLPKPDQGSDAKARLAISAKLPKPVTRTTGMAVRNLSPPATPTAKYGDSEFAIAVAGHDSSVTLYKLEHTTTLNVDLLSNLHPITTFKAVHPGPISGLAFSPFVPPKAPTMRRHNIKLATIGSMGNSLVVHTVPLRKVVEKPPTATARRHSVGPPRPARYVVDLKAHGPSTTPLIVFLTVIMTLLAILGQSLLEIKGLSPPLLHAKRITPASWHYHYGPPVAATSPPKLSDILGGIAGGSGDGKVVMLGGDNEVTVIGEEELDAGKASKAVSWHQLGAEQKAAWKQKLQEAGHWGEGLGEAIFKGVLFGEIGGAVAGAVREL